MANAELEKCEGCGNTRAGVAVYECKKCWAISCGSSDCGKDGCPNCGEFDAQAIGRIFPKPEAEAE